MNRNRKESYLAHARDAAITVAGLTMVLTPLALWASPNLTAFYAALVTCAAAYGLYVLLSRIGVEGTAPNRRDAGIVALPSRLTSLLQNQRELSRMDVPELRDFVQDNMERKPEDD